MKRIVCPVVVAALLVGGFTAAGLKLGWFGARGEVAKDKFLRKIDDLLGKSEVQLKEIDIGIRELKETRDNIQDARITSQVRGKKMKDAIDGVDKQIDDGKVAMRKLKESLDSAETKCRSPASLTTRQMSKRC